MLFDCPFALGLNFSFETAKKMCNVYPLIAGKMFDWGWPEGKKMKCEALTTKVWLAALALGVKEMKDKNVVHLDGHPANMMYDELGYPVWVDFGCSQTGITEPDKGGHWEIIGWPGGIIPETREK